VSEQQVKKSHAKLVGIISLVALGMFGFGFALVPFYDVFCELTGLNGKIRTEAAAQSAFKVDESRELSVEFVTSLNEHMPLAFRAEVPRLKVHPGQYYTVNFYAENQTDRMLAGQAIPSIAPGWAAQYLKKAECFCFSRQEFEPYKERKLPVRFVIDPALPDTVNDMTLSYTFFDITNKNQD